MMDAENFLNSAFANKDVIEALYEKYQTLPEEIDPSWRSLFVQLDGAISSNASLAAAPVASLQPPPKEGGGGEFRIARLINAYRTYGHLAARVNPIETKPYEEHWQLKVETYGFASSDAEVLFPTCGLMKEVQAPLAEIVKTLREIYCSHIGIEYMGVQNPNLIEWVQEQVEPTKSRIKLSIDQKRMILQHLNKSELFEIFLHTKYTGQKRFSLEGGETLIPILEGVIQTGATLGIERFVIGMAHRGRLNVLSNILNKSYGLIFSEFEDRWAANTFEGSGDVKYHKGFTSKRATESGKAVSVELTPNPSHLEAVNAVVEGYVKAKQLMLKSNEAFSQVIPILIHGDAAIAGQGIVYETMQMYDLEGYSTGGTLHLVINNQVGFTAGPEEGRSTLYCTDIARAFNAPVFHVNGEDPESCIFATILALQIRQKFHCDVFIDLNCYRKYGHNESDEPAFTQPLEYKIIKDKTPVREIYRDDLIRQGILEKQMAESEEEKFKQALQKELQETHFPGSGEQNAISPEEKADNSFKEYYDEMVRPVATAVAPEVLRVIGEKIASIPEGFSLHRKLHNLNSDRAEMARGEKLLDWGMGELMAYGTLLWEGVSVRIAGQDSGRGTFSHRHARLVDQKTQKPHFPLRCLREGQGRFDAINSLLSEYAALGFEYGYSLAVPEQLVIWEAQFGDFCNGAQVIIDQFIASSEQKWGQKNSVVLMLPHGYEGQGPEHSSGRMERFLSISAELNWFVVNATTPAQLFHLLRRQVLRQSPKPLILFTPKSLLRHPQCHSPIAALSESGFQEVIDDFINPEEVERVIFCAGKVYYDAIAEREKREADRVAIIRIEQLYPLHEEKIFSVIGKYHRAKEHFWLQEEPKNMGAWEFIRSYFEEWLPEGKLQYVGRGRSAASATGSMSRHKREYERFMNKAFANIKRMT